MPFYYIGNFLAGAGVAAIACGFAFAATSLADAAPNANYGQSQLPGSQLRVDLHRGAVVPIEGTVVTTPGACAGALELQLTWDPGDDRVDVRLRGKAALAPAPDVDREPGVDYLENPHFPEPVDVDAGRYQLWLVGAAGPLIEFYYDKTSYDLLGGAADFASPPADAIAVEFPTSYMLASPLFDPNAKGDVRLDWSFGYTTPTRGDHPELSYQLLAFVPPNLCEYDEFRVNQTNLRAWASDPVAADDAVDWAKYVAGGMDLFVSVEPDDPGDFYEPTLIWAYSNTTIVGGTVPPGWTLHGDTVRSGQGLPIRRWDGADRCEVEFAGFHPGVDNCEPK